MAAASKNPTFAELQQQLSKGILAPVYLLHGEEGYYIDRLLESFEALVPVEDRDFNLYVIYGADATGEMVNETCRRFPMMADRQVVILKEAQSMRANELDKIAAYASNPLSTTLLVIACRGASAKGKDLIAAVKKNGVIFESKKLNERSVAPVIAELVKAKGLNIEPKGLAMMRDFVGTDVSRLYNEIDKLALILGKGGMVTPEVIERNIGISKDFNNFELIDALAQRDAGKAMRIVEYFRANPKNNPTVMTVAAIFNFFTNLIVCQFEPDKSDRNLMGALNFRTEWQLRNYRVAMTKYNAFQAMEIIDAIRQFDTRSKGIGSRQPEHDLMRDLIFHIITAPGHITI